MWGPLISGAWWCWRNISSPPTCCQKVLDQRGERKCIPCCALHPGWVLTWGWVHELLWVVAEQSILDVATAHTTGPWREREMDTRAGLRAACWEMLGPLHSSGSDERCRAWPGAEQGPAEDALSGLVCGVIQPWKRLSMSSGCSPPAPAGDMTAACRAASLARLGGLPMPVESTTKCSVPTAWECLLWCNCTHQSCFE